ncbi:MAG: endolytic transglycosylase MltG [Candidatus Cloacimonadaceae bacterium]|jgi:UPF0755 protein|nr:endolytic transglycosylase MltG [Candidatus Cloacimonadota bacterium]MDY0127665.1 endolytic transglycosylase MltG [Candidatus Cloacimonadaceae bacterium]MCB5254328.1 endolytic transglycosylase MltG [Candidatus Cloacimonadota bacterium]MCK9178860.1 endolytic transglycosylase MltG [Candidatus Cloacimonadota bacterium]MCK9242967.1 endolytic transglycosylase MltG [Candidatus Cloacimonadota bacterium]
MLNKWNYLIIFLIAVMLIFSGFAAYNVFQMKDSREKVVRVQKGDSAATIGQRLQEAGIVKRASTFRLLAKLRGADRQLKPGTYTFGGHTNLWNTVSRLQDGLSETIRLTFPEGLSMYRSFKIISASGLAELDSLTAAATDTSLVHRFTGMPLSSLEGFLYPETYIFPVPCSSDSILAIMTNEFFRKLNYQGININDIPDFYDKLILASIVEKEAGDDSERATVAGVFVRRLRLGMALQSCPTVDYILERQGIKREVLTNADTEIPSPYNTYQNPGLPPTPISNPRVESILAALNPLDQGYLYFFADRRGKNVFSSSYQEHQRLQRQMRL